MKLFKILVFCFLFFLSVFPASAVAKNLSPTASASISKNKRNVTLTFKNIKNLKTVTYEMTYFGSGFDQGVFSTIKNIKTNTLSRSLYLGTCSHNVCTPHKNVKKIEISLIYKTKTGQSSTQLIKL